MTAAELAAKVRTGMGLSQVFPASHGALAELVRLASERDAAVTRAEQLQTDYEDCGRQAWRNATSAVEWKARAERAETALRTIADNAVPTTFGGGVFAIVGFAQAALAASPETETETYIPAPMTKRGSGRIVDLAALTRNAENTLQRIADEADEEADREDDDGARVGVSRYYRQRARHYREAAVIVRDAAAVLSARTGEPGQDGPTGEDVPGGWFR